MRHNYAHDDLVVVRLWENHLLYRHNQLYKDLVELTTDKAAVPVPNYPGKITLRFSREQWLETAKNLLYDNRIPVSIQSGQLQAIRIRGRQPALRVPACV